ncbi:MAG: hypothetical protein JWO81_1354 [Alphaproteobacteria bacterium]|nr:hypothetical protein [Alphaproteobacteria bacterium]
MPRDGSAPTEEFEGQETERKRRPEQDGFAHSLSPVDLPEPSAPLPHGLRWTTTAIACASLVLALLNAPAVRSWSYQLPPSTASARVVSGAEAWYGIVGRAGLNRPVEAMHGWWQAARDMRFHDDARTRPDQASPDAG